MIKNSKNFNRIVFPYSWEDRKTFFDTKNMVLFIPDYLIKYKKEDVQDIEHSFDKKRDINIEFCSGNGDWVVDKSKADSFNWIAVEKKIERVNKIAKKRSGADLENKLLIVCGDARLFTDYYISKGSVSNIYINFPDPWPKIRHSKHRLNSQEFIASIKSLLKPEGKLLITSDNPEFLREAEANAVSIGLHCNIEEISDSFGYSYFRKLWESKGLLCQTLQIS